MENITTLASALQLYIFTIVISLIVSMYSIKTKKARMKFLIIWFLSIVLLPLIYMLLLYFIPAIDLAPIIINMFS
jgi:hypothetical protein